MGCRYWFELELYIVFITFYYWFKKDLAVNKTRRNRNMQRLLAGTVIVKKIHMVNYKVKIVFISLQEDVQKNSNTKIW